MWLAKMKAALPVDSSSGSKYSVAFFGLGLRVGDGRRGVVGRGRRVASSSESEGELGGKTVVESLSLKSKSSSSPSSFWMGVAIR